MKILPILLLAIYVPNVIRTRKDGIAYGALAGMGFNIVELGLYIANLLNDAPVVDTLFQQSTRLDLWGLSAHLDVRTSSGRPLWAWASALLGSQHSAAGANGSDLSSFT